MLLTNEIENKAQALAAKTQLHRAAHERVELSRKHVRLY